jgi:arginase family enzyme
VRHVADYAEILAATDPVVFATDPLPGWAGPAVLFGCAAAALGQLSVDTPYIAAGIPFDGTSSSRPGAAEGPGAIRKSSLTFSSYVHSLGEHEMYDMRTGERFRYQTPGLVDVGDLHVYQTDPEKTFRAVASETRALASGGSSLLLMGGDHSITFATFAGWEAGMADIFSGARVGYVQVDHHFDFGNHSSIHGALYHGSNARRISELPCMSPDRMAFVGAGAVTRYDQLTGLQQAGYQIVSAADIRTHGAHRALAATVESLAAKCDAVYASIDIDVADCSVAPGTGNVTIGGLTGAELFDVLGELRRLPLRALDITEVSPRYDPTGRTALIAAKLLFEFVYRHRPHAAATEQNLLASAKRRARPVKHSEAR